MSPRQTVLVVDDDPKIRVRLCQCLEGGGYVVIKAADGAGVRAAFAAGAPDLVTLDLNLGADDGLDIGRDIRRTHDVPIMMLTGKNDVIDRVVGIEIGADDYLVKPFHVREVLARVRSLLRRSTARGALPLPASAASQDTLDLDGFAVDLDRMLLIERDGGVCDLTTADFKLLAAFVNNAKRPLSRDRLMDLIDVPEWPPRDRMIDNQVARLRKKIERDPACPRLIKTVRGVGYMLTEQATPRDQRVVSTL